MNNNNIYKFIYLKAQIFTKRFNIFGGNICSTWNGRKNERWDMIWRTGN